MTDYEGSVADAITNLADAARTLAAALCSIGAGHHTGTPGEQRDMAAVFFDDAQSRFGDVLRRMDKAQRAKLNAFIDGLCKGKK